MAAGGTPTPYPRDTPQIQVPLARLPPARQPCLPFLRRGRLSARVAPGGRGAAGPAGDDRRPGARRRRRPRAPPLARPRRPDAPRLARAGRGGLLRDLLLRLRDALLSREAPVGARRPGGDASGAGPVLVLARLGAQTAAA